MKSSTTDRRTAESVSAAEAAPAGLETAISLGSVVEKLCEANAGSACAMARNLEQRALPSRDVVIEMVEALRSVIFPGYFGPSEVNGASLRFHVGSTLDNTLRTVREQVKRGLCFACGEHPDRFPECDKKASAITAAFLARLPAVQRMLATDVRAAYEGDPAAPSMDETIFCYPGVLAVTNYRLAHELHALGVPLIPRMITEHAHSITGIDIHPGAAIGESFFIDHGTGVVIGETCVIGDRVRIYQGVTLGAKSFPLDKDGKPIKGVPRHPIVEDEVIIYSGATILGRVVIGKGSVIGGNVWLTRGVPPGSVVSQTGTRADGFENGGGI